MQERNSSLSRLTGDLIVAARLWRKRIRAIIEGHGVAEAGATPLIWVSRLGGDVRQNVVAEHCGIEGASLVRLLDDLVRQGLVTRRQDPTDRRANLVSLTPRGEEIVAAIEAHLVSFRAAVLSDLTPEDVETALRVLGRITDVSRREAPTSSEAD